jgi:gliding motility-associated-like protein
MLDGRIYIKRRFGEGPFSYTINGGAPQASNDFFNLIPGDYTIIGTDGDGCTYLIDTTVIEPGILYADEMPDIVACQGYETMLQGSGYGGTKPYSYFWSNGINGNGVFVVGDDDTTFYLTIVDLYGCTATSSVFIDVIPEPIALAIPDVIYGYANLFVAINNESLYANHYTWDFGNNYITTINTAAYVNTTYTDTGTFTITLTATNGYCEDVWQGNITVIHLDSIEANIPNIFSPNGDGDNDTYFFEMKNVMSIEGAIYNRWGVKIADYNDLNYSWDGKVDGVDAVEGVYYVQFTMIGIDWDIRKDITYFHLVR